VKPFRSRLAENIGRQAQTTSENSRMRSGPNGWPTDLPIADAFLDHAFKQDLKNLSVTDFREFKNAIDVLVKAGRDEKKIYREGEALTVHRSYRRCWEAGDLPSQEYPRPKCHPQGLELLSIPRWSMNIETILNRWDRADPRGIFNRYLSYPSPRLKRQECLEREGRGTGRRSEGSRLETSSLTAPFADPLTRTRPTQMVPMVGFTHANVQAMVHNAGISPTSLSLRRGMVWTGSLMKWLHVNSTKEMWIGLRRWEIYQRLAQKADESMNVSPGANVEKDPDRNQSNPIRGSD